MSRRSSQSAANLSSPSQALPTEARQITQRDIVIALDRRSVIRRVQNAT